MRTTVLPIETYLASFFPLLYFPDKCMPGGYL